MVVYQGKAIINKVVDNFERSKKYNESGSPLKRMLEPIGKLSQWI